MTKLSWLLTVVTVGLLGNPIKAIPSQYGSRYVDSLLMELESAREDTNKIHLLGDLAYSYSKTDPDKGLAFASEALELAEKLDWKKGMAMANAGLGFNYKTQSEHFKALEHELQALDLYEDLGDKEAMAAMEANIALVYLAISDYPKALEYNFKALQVYEELHNEKKKAIIQENIGSIYFEQKNYKETLEYYDRASETYKKLDDLVGFARNVGNTGRVLDARGEYDEALKRHSIALKVNERLGNLNGMQINMANIGYVYSHKKDFENALKYQFKALELSRQLGNRGGVAVNLGNIGETYFAIAQDSNGSVMPDSLIPVGKEANLKKSVEYLGQGITVCEEIHYIGPRIEFTKFLSEAYFQLGDFEASVINLKKHSSLVDSVFSVQNQMKIEELEARRRADLREKDLLLKERQLKIAELEVARKENDMKLYLVSILLLLVFVAILIKTLFSYRKSHQELSMEKKEHMELIEQQISSIKAHSKVLEEITYMQAHDIRGPVATILGLVQILNMENFADPGNKEIIEGIARITEKLDKAVRETIQKQSDLV